MLTEIYSFCANRELSFQFIIIIIINLIFCPFKLKNTDWLIFKWNIFMEKSVLLIGYQISEEHFRSSPIYN